MHSSAKPFRERFDHCIVVESVQARSNDSGHTPVICFDCWHRPRPFIVILCFDLKIAFMFWLFYFIIFIVLTQIFYGLFVVLYLELLDEMRMTSHCTEWFIACVCERNDRVPESFRH